MYLAKVMEGVIISFPCAAATLLPCRRERGATSSSEHGESTTESSKGWAHQGLNLEPPDYESGALTD
jgi:hypothetical protein